MRPLGPLGLRSLPQVSLGFCIAKHRTVHRIRLRKKMDQDSWTEKNGSGLLDKKHMDQESWTENKWIRTNGQRVNLSLSLKKLLIRLLIDGVVAES